MSASVYSWSSWMEVCSLAGSSIKQSDVNLFASVWDAN